MKLGPLTKHDKSNKTTSKKIDETSCQQIVTSMLFFRFMTNLEVFNTSLTLLLWEKVLFLPKNAEFFYKTMLTPASLRELWYKKVYFLKLYIGVYLRTKFQVYSINGPLKPTQIRVKLVNGYRKTIWDVDQ